MLITMKKFITTITLCLAGFLISSGLRAQCQAGFTWVQSAPNTITFTNTSTPVSNFTVFMWSFGDSQSGYSMNPVHVYTTPGTYMACLTMWDSLSSCQSSFCDTIVVTGSVLCTMTASGVIGQQPSCPTCPNGTAGVTTSNGTGPYTYAWSNGATTPANSGLLPGTYSVIVTDANGCTATATVTLTSQQSGGCNASYTFTQGSNGQVSFTNTSTGTNMWTYYAWTFGDNGTSTVASPQHTYTSSGNYIACLTITVYDSAQGNCTSTFCDTIPVILSGMQEYSNTVIKVFPNPAQDHITIQSSAALIRGQEYFIYDLTGKTVQHGRLDSSVIDVRALEAGAYILETGNAENGRSVQRFVKN